PPAQPRPRRRLRGHDVPARLIELPRYSPRMPQPGRPEVLAPAGDAGAMRAAVRAGADAVYFGLKGFNARARADNFDEAALAGALGASRVILARELSLEDIARVRRETAVEVEVFVHGALCVAYSGQCLTSEAIGGRSANRGACAQACRLPYELVVDGVKQDLG